MHLRHYVAGIAVAAGILGTATPGAHAALGRDDHPLAVRLWKPMAERGDVLAQYNLAVAYETGTIRNEAEAVMWFRLAAAEGLAKAQYRLGTLYAAGRGVPRDSAEAVKWLALAAGQGIAQAQLSLANMVDRGDGAPQDRVGAVRWYRLAADQGDALAQFELGRRFYAGDVVDKDYAEAAHWFRLAAEQNLVQAQYNLGLMYAKGEGLPRDNIQAHLWFDLAAAQGHDRAVRGRDIAARLMAADQIAKAQELARGWRPQSHAFQSTLGQ